MIEDQPTDACCTPTCCSGEELGAVKTNPLFFVLVMLAALVVAGWSVANQGGKAEASSTSSEHTNVPANPNTVEALAAQFDVVIVVVPSGEDDNSSSQISNRVQSLASRLNDRGTSTTHVILDVDAADSNEWIAANGLTELPAVLMQGASCGTVKVSGDLSTASLAKAYAGAVSSGGSSCGSSCGGSSSCGGGGSSCSSSCSGGQ